MPSKMMRKGFTLIELLVVIAIIAILAAILFPVFARAKDSANQSMCASNVKQLVMALNMYTSENGDIIPPLYNDDWSVTWIDSVKKYTSNSRKVYNCPSDIDKFNSGSGYGVNYKNAWQYSYAINFWLGGVRVPSQVKKTSGRIAICDGHLFAPLTETDCYMLNPQGWHGNRTGAQRNGNALNDGVVNVGFLDNHVKAVLFKTIDPNDKKTGYKVQHSNYWDVGNLIDKPQTY